MKTPIYTQKLLLRLIFETKNIDDHARLIQLYQDLDAQGDIVFNQELQDVVKSPKHYFRFVKHIIHMNELCAFNLRLAALQQKGFAIVTNTLTRYIAFQRELILEKNKH